MLRGHFDSFLNLYTCVDVHGPTSVYEFRENKVENFSVCVIKKHMFLILMTVSRAE